MLHTSFSFCFSPHEHSLSPYLFPRSTGRNKFTDLYHLDGEGLMGGSVLYTYYPAEAPPTDQGLDIIPGQRGQEGEEKRASGK
jgi:hypothetical protein